MAIDWRLNSGGFDALESLQSFGVAAQQRDQQMQRQRAMAEQQRQMTARQQIGDMIAGGDLAGARNTALQGGDFDLVGIINGYEDHHRQELHGRAELVGGIAAGLRGRSLPERQAAFQAIAPQLVERGFTPDQLAQVDLTDAGLDGYIAFATQAKDAISNYAKQQEGYTLNQGDRRYVGSNMVAENPAAPKYESVPEGGMLVRVDGGATTNATPGYALQAGAPTFNGLPGERVTSTYRTPEHNREVGGVANSYHTRRDANGNPLARDSVPPAGMAMPQYAAEIRRLNPGMQVLNEGDHVHIEPGRQVRNASPDVIYGRPKQAKQSDAPSGYRFNGSRLEPIPGGPADPSTPTNRNVQSDRKAEADFRKEFDGLPEVKAFKTARQQFTALRNIAGNPNATAQDDIAAIFSFMKTLDPTSTVREGEFATAQNATGVPDALRNAFNRAQSGQRLNPQQRKEMINTAYRSYTSFRDAYNQSAENYRGYARDHGIQPDRVARTYTPDQPARQQQKPQASSGWGKATVVR